RCLDCEGPLVPCTCRPGCPGGQCAQRCGDPRPRPAEVNPLLTPPARRCEVTGNPCGSDTWGCDSDDNMIPCECASCTAYLAETPRKVVRCLVCDMECVDPQYCTAVSMRNEIPTCCAGDPACGNLRRDAADPQEPGSDPSSSEDPSSD